MGFGINNRTIFVTLDTHKTSINTVQKPYFQNICSSEIMEKSHQEKPSEITKSVFQLSKKLYTSNFSQTAYILTQSQTTYNLIQSQMTYNSTQSLEKVYSHNIEI